MSTLTIFPFDHKQALIENLSHIILLLKFFSSRGSNKINMQPLQVLFEKDYLKLCWRIPLLDSPFLTKLLIGGLNLKTETLAQMHLCEFHKTFKNTILYYTSS